ncbi:MAG: SDR family NAD(P)-dependent oxidoreductase [Caldilineaceae bacterium]|nr:SDR family NAD(P)-dependent oxidoreductase [Caldilineaceae bacterium]
MERADKARVAVVTGADRGLGQALTAGLLEQGWRVFAGQYMPDWPELSALAATYPQTLTCVPLDVAGRDTVQAAAQTVRDAAGQVDLLINNAGVGSPASPHNLRETQDYAEMHRLYDVNALGPIRMVEAFLPLMDGSPLRRLCFVSSEAGSVGRARRTSWYGYCMSKAALNMAVKIMFNHLRPEGYSFRVYHPGWVRSYMSGKKNLEATLEPEDAARYALAYFLQDEGVDEDTLALRDWEGKLWEW